MVRKKGITKSADVYGLGCVIYEMLVGEAPFYDENLDRLTKKIESGKFEFPNYVQPDARKVIKVTYALDPNFRDF